MRLACWAATKVGLAMQERKTKTTAELHRDSTAQFIQFIDSCDVVLLCQEHFQTDSCPGTEQIAAIKSTLKKNYSCVSSNDKVNTDDFNKYIIMLILCYVLIQSVNR
jgi:hypothetical protein